MCVCALPLKLIDFSAEMPNKFPETRDDNNKQEEEEANGC